MIEHQRDLAQQAHRLVKYAKLREYGGAVVVDALAGERSWSSKV